MPSGYYRFPSIHRDGVAFVSEDDLWSVPAAGGVAHRLTSNLGEVSRPAFSPDGSQLAFVGREEGQSEVYVMPAQGGPARRLTFMGGSLCLVAGWTAEGKIIFASNAEHWYLRFTHLYTVDVSGRAPQRLPYGLARAVAYGPQGGVVIGRNTDDPARWKRYRGGTAGQLWIDEASSGDFRPLIRLDGNLACPMWVPAPGTQDGRVYFVADHEGIGNLYSCLPSGEDLRRHTDHEDFYVRNAATDGRRIVYHAGADLYLYDLENDRSQLIDIAFHSPQTQRNRKFVDAARYLGDWTIHPQGQAVAISARGKAFTFANWEGAVLQHGESSGAPPAGAPVNDGQVTGARYRLPRWLNDGKRLLAVTDSGGEESFVLWNADGSGERVTFADLDIGRPEALAVSPKKDQLVFSNHRYELMFLDLETRELKLVDRGQAAPISGFAWSPDGAWLAYSVSISLQVTALKLWNQASGEITLLTRPLLRDVSPAFDPQGRFLYLLSYRTFDPVADALQFDLGFPRGMKPYLVTLQKDLHSPFIPRPRLEEDKEGECEDQPAPDEGGGEAPGEPGSGAEPGVVPEAGKKADEKDKKKEAEKPTQIDLEGIQDRMIAFPLPEGTYGRILGVRDGKVVYSRFPTEGTLNGDENGEPAPRGTLYTYNFEEQKEEMVAGGVVDFTVSANGRFLLYRSGRRLRVIRAGEKTPDESGAPARKNGWLDLGRVKVSVVPGAEWRQMFREAWRLQRDQFWTPDMSQVDWLGVHDRYLPLVDRVSSRSEFSDLMWEMQGELGTSHAYEFGGDYRPAPHYQQGFLGADFTYDTESGGWRVAHIYRGDAWERRADSPMNKPGVAVAEGDLLLAVNGHRLSETLPPQAALVNLAGEEVDLIFAGPCEGATRTVTVEALSSETPARYREWVEQNRQRVHAATGGRVGYLHIPDMGSPGYAEFHRGYLAEYSREGLIVDVRFNRGGYVSALLLEKLARKRIGYDIPRWSQVPAPYPPESVLGPVVALTNEYAGSDGDIFCHGFKLMKLGPLLGKRTWGGVIGIWPRHSLVDGTTTTQPEFSTWFADVGWGLENYGTDPDIDVDILPQDYARGVDAQLERAIAEVLHLLEAAPPGLPNFEQRPSRAIPRLPPR